MFHHWLIWPILFWGPFHGLFSLFVVILIFSLVFGRRRYYYGYGPYWHWNRRSDALTTLEERYARGEIQRDEYLQKKHDLGG